MADKAWSGVFNQPTDALVERFTESISFDRRLYAQDITGSIAHAQMLAKVGLLSHDECRQIEQGLGEIRQQIEQGQFRFATELEDIHMHIESALIERLGDVGRKLHTARSRNDQVATDLRLWVRDAIDQVNALQGQALGGLDLGGGRRQNARADAMIGKPGRRNVAVCLIKRGLHAGDIGAPAKQRMIERAAIQYRLR